ncbi:MAG: hypothetical protein OXG05_12580 [Gammaproteobacteria bacterium]|nr:hypothetical protein [Gammaproteobacteria bacterium]
MRIGTPPTKTSTLIALRPYSEWFYRFALIEPMVLREMNPLSAGRSIKVSRTIATELGWHGKI